MPRLLVARHNTMNRIRSLQQLRLIFAAGVPPRNSTGQLHGDGTDGEAVDKEPDKSVKAWIYEGSHTHGIEHPLSGPA